MSPSHAAHRSPSRSRKRDDASTAGPSTAPLAGRALSPSPSVPQTAAGSGSRRVKTVPPSARWDPPTPPPSSPPPTRPVSPSVDAPGPSKPLATAPPTRRKRPRLKLRYSTDSSSASGANTSDDDDEDPPWWTFTQRGMAKMRARALREDKGKSESDTPTPTVGKRRSMGDIKGPNTTPTRPVANSRSSLLHPLPIRHTSSNVSSILHRRSLGSPSPVPILPPIVIDPSGALALSRQATIARSNSAPSSPVPNEVPSPGMATLVGSLSGHPETVPLPLEIPPVTRSLPIPPPPATLSSPDEHSSPALRRKRLARRQMTAPAFPRFLRRDNIPEDHATDSEAYANDPSRARSKPGTSRRASEDGEDGTPTQPRPKMGMRKGSHMLRMGIQPVTQHFKDGWPHAGSWQDALYGRYDEAGGGASGRTKSDEVVAGVTKRLKEEERKGGGRATPPRLVITPEAATPQRSEQAAGPVEKKRTKKRGKYRYKEALVPPTPRGLGFTPAGEEGAGFKAGGLGPGTAEFDWTAGDGSRTAVAQEPQDRVDAGQDQGLDRWGSGTTRTDGSAGKKRGAGWLPFFGGGDKGGGGGGDIEKQGGIGGLAGRNKQRFSGVESTDWRKRYRRMLFLDARVTIWIRTINLIITAASIALAISIRLKLIHLRLPGLIGSSTTLVIAYSSLTALHVLTAIYREYFGKPIGLWGLRSKMLWVCLDLLFVALWSSAMSIALNDYIATPLMCTPRSPWWREGLSDTYAELLAELASSHTIDMNGFSHSLGITLPDAVLQSSEVAAVCRRQVGCIAMSLVTLLLYGGNMVLSLFRIFETVRRTADVGRAVTM